MLSTEFPLGDNIDIAVATFAADEEHNLLPINALTPKIEGLEGAEVGNPLNSWNTQGAGARMGGVSMPSGAITVPMYRYEEFGLQDRVEGNKDGYEFFYTASTVPGMSGGPIIGYRAACAQADSKVFATGFFSLLAIHGRSEGYVDGGRSGISLGVPVDLIKEYLVENGTELGIPIEANDINQTTITQYCK